MKEWASKRAKKLEDYRKQEDTKLVHFIGKDNTFFTALFFRR
jgi:methionyl-tRNA synthetase